MATGDATEGECRGGDIFGIFAAGVDVVGIEAFVFDIFAIVGVVVVTETVADLIVDAQHDGEIVGISAVLIVSDDGTGDLVFEDDFVIVGGGGGDGGVVGVTTAREAGHLGLVQMVDAGCENFLIFCAIIGGMIDEMVDVAIENRRRGDNLLLFVGFTVDVGAILVVTGGAAAEAKLSGDEAFLVFGGFGAAD